MSAGRAALDAPRVLAAVRRALEGSADRAAKLGEIAGILREAGGYRWVGIYDVSGDEVGIVAWSGKAEPRQRTERAAGWFGHVALERKQTLLVGDVRRDARDHTQLRSTRSRMVVPILDTIQGRVRGALDAESDRVEAFDASDRELFESCAAELSSAGSPSPG